METGAQQASFVCFEVTIAAVFVRSRSRKIFLLNPDANYRIRENGKVVFAEMG